MATPAAKRAVAESCADYLTLELVNNYRRQLQGPPLQVGWACRRCRHRLWCQGQGAPCQRGPALLSCLHVLHPDLQAALDAIGERVGRQLVERYSKERPPLLEQVGGRLRGLLCVEVGPPC